MRWFVVWASEPFAQRPSGVTQAHPPGPGLPLHAPSVHTRCIATTLGKVIAR